MAHGDDEFVEFAQLNSRRLIHAAFLLTGDRHEAEDLAQAALVRTYAAWPRVRRQSAHAYARTALVNLVRDQWRRPLREYATEFVPEQVGWTDFADDVADRRWIVDLLGFLAPQERLVVVLRHYFDLSEIQAATQMKVTVGTIKSTNARALTKLRTFAHAMSEHDAVTRGGER